MLIFLINPYICFIRIHQQVILLVYPSTAVNFCINVLFFGNVLKFLCRTSHFSSVANVWIHVLTMSFYIVGYPSAQEIPEEHKAMYCFWTLTIYCIQKCFGIVMYCTCMYCKCTQYSTGS